MSENRDNVLKQLKLGVERTENILDSGKPDSIKRNLNALRETIRETNEHKRAVDAEKIEADESIEKINEWNLGIEVKIEQGDGEIKRLEQWLFEKEQSEKHVAQEKQFKIELKLHEKRLKMKAELKLTQTKPELQECSDFKTAKSPKLVISTFDGPLMDWPRLILGTRNPAVSNEKERDERKSIFRAREDEARVRGCVYCEDTGHKATQCDKITDTSERKKILTKKGNEEKLMTDDGTGEGIFHVVVVKLKWKKPELLNIINPGYEELRRKYSHFQGAVIDDPDTKEKLPIHLVKPTKTYEKVSFGKAQLGTTKRQTKLLGRTWDKTKDTLSVETNQKPVTTKREALSELAKVYDPLGLVSPTTLAAKQLYRDMCKAKLPWDWALTEQIRRRWEEWQLAVSMAFTVPRSLAPFFQPVTAVTLHAFGDASKLCVPNIEII
ncbi:Hypothetical predicted protein [Paramuricea clavata]|uniref:Uncharacterized protein n=1 Tax=Paramuricea clavata TaxID=317549 RepID=A0A6S7HCV9_PARCT|nr:Hypothetical predicted protein [Paramuricea clavata]